MARLKEKDLPILQARKLTPLHVIGIDTGEHTGFAVYNTQLKQFDRLETMDFWEAHDAILEYSPDSTLIVIELTKSLSIWTAGKRVSTNNPRAFGKAAANVGGVRKQSELLVSRFEKLGYNVMAQHPLGDMKAAAMSKFFQKA